MRLDYVFKFKQHWRSTMNIIENTHMKKIKKEKRNIYKSYSLKLHIYLIMKTKMTIFLTCNY